ncbi:hypothetical protein VEV11M_43930 (plasmid) [Escherichia coli]|nr:hypothetical protein VEV11M_43930 [Escherichia coli]
MSDTQGDLCGLDILSFEEDAHERFIEVKTTNGGVGSSFLVSHNELEFSKEVRSIPSVSCVPVSTVRACSRYPATQPTCASQADGLPGEFPEFAG